MAAETDATVREAVILMAGAGSRLGAPGGALAKPLVEIAGRPLIAYTLRALQSAGVETVFAVMGANPDRLEQALAPHIPAGMRLAPVINPMWQMQNGVSVLAAQRHVRGPFFLLMGDHLFDPVILSILSGSEHRPCVLLAVDRKISAIFDLDDAMKVKTDGARIEAIAKDLGDYDAIDTGVFLCTGEIFTALAGVREAKGDCSLAEGIRALAGADRVRAIDVGDAWWQDVDTPAMLAHAGEVLARFLDDRGSWLSQEGVAGEDGADRRHEQEQVQA